MKNIRIYTLILCIVNLYVVSGQDRTIETLGKDDTMYIYLNDDRSFFVVNNKGQDKKPSLEKENIINIRRNYMELYFEWRNPLKYQLTIKDSLIVDSRIEDVNKAIKNITAIISKANGGNLPTPTLGAALTCNVGPYSSFKGDYYDILNAGSARISNSEVCSTFKLLYNLNDLNIPNVEESLLTQGKKLFEVHDIEKLQETINDAEDLIKNFKDEYASYVSGLFNLKQAIAKLNPTLDSQLINKTEKLHKEQVSSLKKSVELIPKLEIFISKLKKSIKNKSIHVNGQYQKSFIKLKKGKSVQVKIKETEMSLNESDLLISKGDETKEFTIEFRRYDFIKPSLGSGLFYANTKIEGFGVSTNDSDELIVSSDDIEKDTAVIGAFLNLNFDLGSQFFSPLIQIGIDPTKERPFLLLGAGFSIPVSNFAITGGPIWTWTPELTKLSIDEVVSSTSVLDDDVSYKFQTDPKGFYLGLTYSF